MFEYNAEVTRVVDGDTLDLRVDLGFTVSVDIRVRLYGIDTPEVYGTKHKDPEQHARGLAASEFAKQWLAQAGNRVKIRTSEGTGKYGRWIATVWLMASEMEGDPFDRNQRTLNNALVNSGHAIRKDY